MKQNKKWLLACIFFNPMHCMDLDALLDEAYEQHQNTRSLHSNRFDQEFLKEVKTQLGPLYKSITTYNQIITASENSNRFALTINFAFDACSAIKNTNKYLKKLKYNEKEQLLLEQYIKEKNNQLIEQDFNYSDLKIYIKNMHTPELDLNANFPIIIKKLYVSQDKYIENEYIPYLFEHMLYTCNQINNNSEQNIHFCRHTEHDLRLGTSILNDFYQLAGTAKKEFVTKIIEEKCLELLQQEPPITIKILKKYIRIIKQKVEEFGITNHFKYPRIILESMKKIKLESMKKIKNDPINNFKLAQDETLD